MSFVNEDHAQMFGRIRLHGLTKSPNGTPRPIELERKISFPMPADCTDIEADHHDKDLSSRLLAPKYDIEARVCFQRPVSQENDDGSGELGTNMSQCVLGFGRAGTVYPLEIISVKALPTINDSGDSSVDPIELPTLPPLCIKVATPGYARNLAREAWFYEQFDAKNLTRFATPRCYGVFHASNIPETVVIDIPGRDDYSNVFKPIYSDVELYTSSLLEEFYDEDEGDIVFDTQCFMDDSKKSYFNSEWRLFRETPDMTTMTVLVMDLLGPSLTFEDFAKDWDGDINEIWDHLTPHDILHQDVRFANVLKVPPHLQVPCPIHPNAGAGHRWALTDWEGARIICTDPTSIVNVWVQRTRLWNHPNICRIDQTQRRCWTDYFDWVPESGQYVYLGPQGRKQKKDLLSIPTSE